MYIGGGFIVLVLIVLLIVALDASKPRLIAASPATPQGHDVTGQRHCTERGSGRPPCSNASSSASRRRNGAKKAAQHAIDLATKFGPTCIS